MSFESFIYSVGIGVLFFFVAVMLFLAAERVHKRMGRPILLLIGIALGSLLAFSTCGTLIRESIAMRLPAAE